MTTPYHIRVAPIALEQIKLLPNKQRKLVIKVIEALAMNPRPPGTRKIEGMTGLHVELVDRLRLRLIYKVEDQEILLLLVK